ncbi:hypothetical protein JAO78_005085 [Alishewanella sp. 16-MA]|uniref:DUF4397 domain-containing protein n=1 Tax=Alishewanella maricola TaxID=2795740 RepID=A0ABS8C222_9ALTE|nr:hypothetical protein [Alishewanella maricola]MCB5226185.1 hypothetical protein [Alishewanella maricola]
MELSAYRNIGNIEKVAFSQDAEPLNFDLAGITAVKLLVNGEQIPATVTGEKRNVVAIRTGQITLRPGTYDGFLVVFSEDFPTGEVIAGPGSVVDLTVRVFL